MLLSDYPPGNNLPDGLLHRELPRDHLGRQGHDVEPQERHLGQELRRARGGREVDERKRGDEGTAKGAQALLRHALGDVVHGNVVEDRRGRRRGLGGAQVVDDVVVHADDEVGILRPERAGVRRVRRAEGRAGARRGHPGHLGHPGRLVPGRVRSR